MFIGRDSVDQAIELLGQNEKGTQNNDCLCTILEEKDGQLMTSFTSELALSELRSYIARHDWSLCRSLFPLLLREPIEIEPLIWRYAFIIALYGNAENFSNISQFLEYCIGSRETEAILRNLLLFSKT